MHYYTTSSLITEEKTNTKTNMAKKKRRTVRRDDTRTLDNNAGKLTQYQNSHMQTQPIVFQCIFNYVKIIKIIEYIMSVAAPL